MYSPQHIIEEEEDRKYERTNTGRAEEGVARVEG